MNSYSNHNTPPIYTLNRTSDGEIIKLLEENLDFNTRLKDYDLTEKEFFTIETEEGVDLNTWMMKPTDFDSKKKYPLYMFLYGGPGSQQVTDSWGWFNYFWYQHLNQLGYHYSICRQQRYRRKRFGVQKDDLQGIREI